MSYVPLKQKVTFVPAAAGRKLDDWGQPVKGEPIVLKCRFVEHVKVVQSMTSAGGVNGIAAEQVTSSAQITLDRFFNVSPKDRFLYTDESGQEREYRPLQVTRIRGLNGKTLLTQIDV